MASWKGLKAREGFDPLAAHYQKSYVEDLRGDTPLARFVMWIINSVIVAVLTTDGEGDLSSVRLVSAGLQTESISDI